MDFFQEHKIKGFFIFPHNRIINLRNTCAHFLLATILIGSQLPLAFAMNSDDSIHHIPTKRVKLESYTDNLDNEESSTSYSFFVSLSENANDFHLLPVEEGIKIMLELLSQAYPKNGRKKESFTVEPQGKENKVWFLKKDEPNSSFMTFKEIADLLAPNATFQEGVYFLAENTKKVRSPLTEELIEKRRKECMQREIYYREREEAEKAKLMERLEQICDKTATMFVDFEKKIEEDFANNIAKVELLEHQVAGQQTTLQTDIQNLKAQFNPLKEQKVNIDRAIGTLGAKITTFGISTSNIEIITDEILELENNKEEKASSSTK